MHFLSSSLLSQVYSPPLNVPGLTSLRCEQMLCLLFMSNLSWYEPHPQQLNSQEQAASRGLLASLLLSQEHATSHPPVFPPGSHLASSLCPDTHHPHDIPALWGHWSCSKYILTLAQLRGFCRFHPAVATRCSDSESIEPNARPVSFLFVVLANSPPTHQNSVGISTP